jgi:hypothetical protein
MADSHQNEEGSAVTVSKPKHAKASNWGKRELRWDDIVIVIFALLGFVGSVVLYRTKSAPPPIISFFLATGVASLVYRFLGGLEKAELVWGTLRVGGTMAALIGIAVYVNGQINAQQRADDLKFKELGSLDGLYEWQVASAAWKGYIKVEKDGSASIDMQRYLACGGEQKPVKLLKQAGPGKVQVNDNQMELHINIPVQFMNYDANCNLTGIAETTVLIGDLPRTPAYAGSIEYSSKYGAPLGGIVLVKGITP